MTGPYDNPSQEAPATRWLGGLLLAHFIAVVAIKCAQGRAPEILWLSHLTLALTALAWLTGRDRLARIALTTVAGPHLLWLGDAATLWATGRSPLHITAYLAHATAADWAATAHHFYLLPLLCVTLRRRGGWDRFDALGAWALIAAAFAAARILSSPSTNVNYAYGLLGTWRTGPLDWVNTAPPSAFAMCYLATAAICVVVPGSMVVYTTTRRRAFDPGIRCGSSLGVRSIDKTATHAEC